MGQHSLNEEGSMRTEMTWRIFLGGVILASFCSITSDAQQAASTPDGSQLDQTKVAEEQAVRKGYSDNVSQTYNYRFGKDKPSLPGNAAAVGEGFLEPSAFPNAEYCGHCHQQA